MTVIISIVVFLFGMFLAVQVVASLYGPVDYSYTIKTKLPEVILKILIWCGLSVFLAILLGDRYRPSFLWGLLAYAVFYSLSYPANKLMLKRNLKLLDRE
ncbi:hypothetical protein ACFL7M_04280 [Thermodesulfobacteriota bacterium]